MPGACHQDVVTTLHLRVITGVEHVKAIKILQIKANSSLRPVDFQVIALAAPDCKTSGLEASDAAISKARQHQYGVIYLPAGGKSVNEGRNFIDPPIQHQSQVD